ncbi:MAG: hypothetical protein AB4058_11505 [Microcystaceae cyanobacterium]
MEIMERLNFTLPDFTRISWVSDSAREIWEPRLSQITQAWLEIEWLSVLSGVRSCCLTTITPEEFVSKAGAWAKQGLNALPLQIQGFSNYSYSNTSIQAEFGKPFGFRIVIGTPEQVSAFQNAFETSDEQEIGRLLGFPSCCNQFFQETWVEQGLVDTTWPMAVNTALPSEKVETITVTGAPEANILWRWMGIRAVPHLPCSFNCQATIEFGKQLIEVGREAGYNGEMDWLLEILNWSVEWSALHGIAEIKTPILKVSTRTDATPIKYVVRREGETAPLEGAKGLNFPYSTPRKPLLTSSSGFQRGLDNPIATVTEYPEWYATDNGFNSRFTMENAYKPIVDLVTATLSGNGGNILDLGCGNGALLKRIYEANPKTIPFGIEIDPSRIEHGKEILPQFASNLICANMFEENDIWSDHQPYTLAILMPGRLIEADTEQSAQLKTRIEKYCDHILVYADGDWLLRYENLAGLAREAGIQLLSSDHNGKIGLAKFL